MYKMSLSQLTSELGGLLHNITAYLTVRGGPNETR